MDNRFFSLFNLTEDRAIEILDTPPALVSEDDSRYIAASHLINFQTDRSIAALMRALQETDPSLDNKIVRRKSIEILGRLKAVQALPAIRVCLQDQDCYTVENAAWAIGEIGTQDPEILAELTKLLEKPGQSYRVMIHTLTKLNYQPAVPYIKKFIKDEDPPIASAAIAGVCRLTVDYTQMSQVVAILQSPNVLGRRLSIQDLMDARYYDAIPDIASCPVSLVFRLRGIRTLAEAGIGDGSLTFAQIQPYLEQSLRDRPQDLKLVHSYDRVPELPALIRNLYETDFGKCYLATQTIVEQYPDTVPAALFADYEEEANNDYGAHFHVMKIMGWLKHAPAYDLLVEALHNTQPQFQKSRAAAAIALGEIGDVRAIPELHKSLETKIWDLKYAALMALEQLGDNSGYGILKEDPDWLVRAKAQSKLSTS